MGGVRQGGRLAVALPALPNCTIADKPEMKPEMDRCVRNHITHLGATPPVPHWAFKEGGWERNCSAQALQRFASSTKRSFFPEPDTSEPCLHHRHMTQGSPVSLGRVACRTINKQWAHADAPNLCLDTSIVMIRVLITSTQADVRGLSKHLNPKHLIS